MSAEIKLTPYLDGFPNINVESLLELLRDLRQTTTSKSEQETNSKEIEPCLRLLVKMVEHLDGGNVDNVIDKFVLSICSRVGVQFIGNTIVENDENQKLVWNHSDKLKIIFRRDDTKIKNYTSMVYYNLMLSFDEARRGMLEDEELLFMILDEAVLGLGEFPQFTIEKFLEMNHFDKLYSGQIRLVHRLYILDMICSLLRADKGFVLHTEHVRKISEDFKREMEMVLNGLRVKNPPEETEVKEDCDPRLAVKLLTCLCSLTSDDACQKIISEDSSLLIYVIYVLRALKMIEDGQKESEDKTTSNPAVVNFKGDLIRLLGNLCWKNTKNQNLVRENKCIELILENCKLDENNPFICEWSIMAIRNLCEGNKENQELISSLKPVTPVELAALNRRLELDLNTSDKPDNSDT